MFVSVVQGVNFQNCGHLVNNIPPQHKFWESFHNFCSQSPEFWPIIIWSDTSKLPNTSRRFWLKRTWLCVFSQGFLRQASRFRAYCHWQSRERHSSQRDWRIGYYPRKTGSRLQSRLGWRLPVEEARCWHYRWVPTEEFEMRNFWEYETSCLIRCLCSCLDYFNYGFNEETWRAYCERQRCLRMESGAITYKVRFFPPKTDFDLIRLQITNVNVPQWNKIKGWGVTLVNVDGAC